MSVSLIPKLFTNQNLFHRPERTLQRVLKYDTAVTMEGASDPGMASGLHTLLHLFNNIDQMPTMQQLPFQCLQIKSFPSCRLHSGGGRQFKKEKDSM